MNKSKMLDAIRTERARWEALLEEVGEARMTEPGVAGEWTVKDVIAHIAFFEREMVGLLEARALVGSELWQLSQDERNAAIYQQNRDRPLNEVLAEAQEVYRQFLAEMEKLEDEDLHDASRFREMPGDWLPWQVIAGNSYDHYRHHIPDVRAWLETRTARKGE